MTLLLLLGGSGSSTAVDAAAVDAAATGVGFDTGVSTAVDAAAVDAAATGVGFDAGVSVDADAVAVDAAGVGFDAGVSVDADAAVAVDAAGVGFDAGVSTAVDAAAVDAAATGVGFDAGVSVDADAVDAAATGVGFDAGVSVDADAAAVDAAATGVGFDAVLSISPTEGVAQGIGQANGGLPFLGTSAGVAIGFWEVPLLPNNTLVLAWSEEPDTASGDGWVSATGPISFTEEDDLVESEWHVDPPFITGTVQWTDAEDAVQAAASSASGTIAWQEQDDTTEVLGSWEPAPISSTVAWVEEDDSVQVVGDTTIIGTIAWTDEDDSLYAGVPIATAAWSEESDTAVSYADFTAAEIIGGGGGGIGIGGSGNSTIITTPPHTNIGRGQYPVIGFNALNRRLTGGKATSVGAEGTSNDALASALALNWYFYVDYDLASARGVAINAVASTGVFVAADPASPPTALGGAFQASTFVTVNVLARTAYALGVGLFDASATDNYRVDVQADTASAVGIATDWPPSGGGGGTSVVVNTSVSPIDAAASGAGFDAVFSVPSSASVEVFFAVGTANDTGLSSAPTSLDASASGSSFAASVSIYTQAVDSIGTGFAFDPLILASPLDAAATGTAFDAGFSASIPAFDAAATGSGFGATIAVSTSAQDAIGVGFGLGLTVICIATGTAFDASAVSSHPQFYWNGTDWESRKVLYWDGEKWAERPLDQVAPVAPTGPRPSVFQPVWNGSQWAAKKTRYWDGEKWVEAIPKQWDGQRWRS